MAAAEGNVVTVEEAAGLNQALVLQCSLVTLKDSPRKSQKEGRTVPGRWSSWQEGMRHSGRRGLRRKRWLEEALPTADVGRVQEI